MLCYVLSLFWHCSGVLNAMLPIRTKLRAILKLVRTLRSLTGKGVKGDNDSTIKSIIYFAINHLIFTILPC